MEQVLGDRDRTLRMEDGLEKYINKVSGVLSSKIVKDENGRIIEVHVLSDYSRSPKQIVRDIQSCVAAVFGFQLEYRTISVAQIDSGLKSKNSRLQLKNMQIQSEGSRLMVKTQLGLGDGMYEGTASGMSGPRARYVVAASACVSAVHAYLGSDMIFIVSDVQKLSIAGADSFCVALNYCFDGNQGMLVGASVQKEDEYRSVVKATLDAVNRILERISAGGRDISSSAAAQSMGTQDV
ncbi:MAG TPA: hypothetical protein DD727_07845 [Clostridiales bacterium]|nr:hypothetical protein [Clostridiales bacterium]